MAETIALAAKARDSRDKAKALRRAGMVPGVVYGHAFEATSVQFEYRELSRVLNQAGTSRLITMDIEGLDASPDVFIRSMQRDPVTDLLIHVDLLAVVAGETLTNMIPLVQVGIAPVLEAELGSTVVQMVDSIEVEALPRDMPANIELDMTKLTMSSSALTVADLVIPAGVQVLTSMDTELVMVALQRAEEEEEVEEELEGEEAVEGEETDDEAAIESAEDES